MFGFGKRRAASGDQAKPAATNQAQREAHVRLLGKVPMFLDLSKRDLGSSRRGVRRTGLSRRPRDPA